MNHPTLALKLLARDWRSGELTLLVMALFIAVTAATAVSLLGDRLERTMTRQAAEFLGADLSVNGHQVPPTQWQQQAHDLGLQSAVTAEFSSMLVENEALLLVGVKAIPEGYPLRGALKTSSATEAISETHAVPALGEVWVEPRVLVSLHLKLGDTLTVGERALRIMRLIEYEPDRRGDIYSLSPRVLINAADLAATRIVQPGSHVHYYSLFSGPPTAIGRLKAWLKPQLQAGQHISDINEDRPELGNAIVRAERFLGLASIAVVLIAGVAIAMSARRYTERHFDLMAIMKCLGARERDVLGIALWQFLFAGLITTSFGCIAGWGLQQLMVHLVGDLLPAGLAPAGPLSWLFGLGTGLLILFGFSLPPILRLKRLPPLRVLRRELEPLPASALFIYGSAGLTLALLLWRYTGDWKSTLTVLGVCASILAGFASLAFGLLRLARLLMPRVSLPTRLGLQHLARQPRLGITQILAFSITLTAMQIIFLVRTELIQQWQQQLPVDAPNHFALNLFDADREPFRALLQQSGIKGSALYPVVRGRLIAINERDVAGLIKGDSRAEGAINRELSLTWGDILPPDNRIIAGTWWNSTDAGVSIEQELAKRLGVALGDRLSFSIGGQTLIAPVTSTRSVHWDSMTPNFYMIFSPGTLDGYPHTWLTSFHVPAADKTILPRLAKAFPGMTLLAVDALIGQFQAIVQQVTLAVEFVLALALLAGFTVLFATVRLTLDERAHENAVVRAMGGEQRLIRQAQWVEFGSLGLMAGLISALLAELIVFVVYSQVLELDYRIHWWNFMMSPVLGGLAVGIAGYLNTRKIVTTSPLEVLRQL
jgi:putative ABC transport system permease protein